MLKIYFKYNIHLFQSLILYALIEMQVCDWQLKLLNTYKPHTITVGDLYIKFHLYIHAHPLDVFISLNCILQIHIYMDNYMDLKDYIQIAVKSFFSKTK